MEIIICNHTFSKSIRKSILFINFTYLIATFINFVKYSYFKELLK